MRAPSAPLALAAVASALLACEPLPPARTPLPAPPPAPSRAGAHDPINQRDVRWLHAEAERVMHELLAALPDDWRRDEVDGVELSHEEFFGIVNAFAGCEGLAPRVAVTDGLLELIARLAAARAMEERFDVDAVGAFERYFAEHHRAPPLGREDPAMWNDAGKLALQRDLYDEMIGWVIGHELAHHYLGHVRCGRDGGVVDDLRHVAHAIVPAFQQLDELAADAAGIDLLLITARRTGRPWHERGARLLLGLFAHVEHFEPTDLALAFVLTHPPATVRLPALRATVAAWYVTDGHLPTIPVPKI